MSVILNSLRLKKPDENEDFLKIPILSIKNTLVDLTQKKLTIGTFSTEKGNLTCNRLKNGDFDLLKLFSPPPPKEEPVKQEKGKEEEKKWIVTLGRLSVDQYTVKMGDLSLSQPTALTGEKITLLGENISTAKNTSGKLSLSLQLDQTGTLSTKNTIVIDPLKIQGSIEVKHLLLKKYAPYYQDSILFDIDEGDLDVSTNYQYNKRDNDSEAKLSGLSISLRNLKLKKSNEQEGFLNIPILTIQNTGLDLNKKEISVGDFSTQNGAVLVKRLKDGKLNLQTLFPEPSKKEEKLTQENVEKAEKPWVVRLGKISVEGYQIKGEDQTPAETVTMMIDEIHLKANNLSTAEGQKGNASSALRLNQRGAISTEGAIGINPISANLKISLKEIEVKPFQPYFTDKVKITVTDGALSTTGNFTLGFSDKKELKATYSGGASLNHFASIDKLNAEDILKMESLAFDDIHFDSNPFSMDVKGIALSNFYARVLINPDGKLNLQEILAKEEANREAPSKKKTPPPEKKGAESSKEKEPPKNIKIGNITLQGGRIDFSDKSINPEFSAKFSEIGGRVSGRN
jgi:hypothetical protein